MGISWGPKKLIGTFWGDGRGILLLDPDLNSANLKQANPEGIQHETQT